jgi:hypothetical protein
MSPPLTADALQAVAQFIDQVVARGLMAASSVEVQTIQRLVHECRVQQPALLGRRPAAATPGGDAHDEE